MKVHFWWDDLALFGFWSCLTLSGYQVFQWQTIPLVIFLFLYADLYAAKKRKFQ